MLVTTVYKALYFIDIVVALLSGSRKHNLPEILFFSCSHITKTHYFEKDDPFPFYVTLFNRIILFSFK